MTCASTVAAATLSTDYGDAATLTGRLRSTFATGDCGTVSATSGDMVDTTTTVTTFKERCRVTTRQNRNPRGADSATGNLVWGCRLTTRHDEDGARWRTRHQNPSCNYDYRDYGIRSSNDHDNPSDTETTERDLPRLS
ncbi:hypothetical protein RRG08_045542 [Elysia crispata]|uniref:Uncharacterized protein n=1 Tax=Elysia crispata TaxID=231223 RepID=A0AAE1DFJ8_9GAST|nr:hypothetical protein RRG08_045542 [Elysia crispata]